MKFNIFLPLGFSVIIAAVITLFLLNPQVILMTALVVVLLSFFIAWSFCSEAKDFSGWWQFSLLPILTNLISIGYLVIQSETWIIYITMAFLAVFNYIYWRYLYFYLNNSSRYQSFSLEYLSFYIDFALAFFLSASVFGLRSFLELSVHWSLIIIAGGLALIVFQFSWINKYNYKNTRTYLIAIWLILMQLFAVLMYLPLNYNSLGFIWSIAYYLLLVIVNDKIKDKLNTSRLRIYLLVSFICLAATMLSARWL